MCCAIPPAGSKKDVGRRADSSAFPLDARSLLGDSVFRKPGVACTAEASASESYIR